uniref:Fibronectin type-III domain-containing protein n=1 Tax=viral metagenome TaxID=1070528 RepID=A0A6C0C1U3_9ZZZZ
MSFTINIFNNKFKPKHQNARNDFKKAVKNNNINTRFRVPYSGTRKTIDCTPCISGNTKVIKQFKYTNKCESDCNTGINKIKRSKDGIITDSNFRFTMLEVLERNNKTYQQNAYNFFDQGTNTNNYLINNNEMGFNTTNNGGVKCGKAVYKYSNPLYQNNSSVPSSNRLHLLKKHTIMKSQIENCKNNEDCIDLPGHKLVGGEKSTVINCKPSRINGQKQTCSSLPPLPKSRISFQPTVCCDDDKSRVSDNEFDFNILEIIEGEESVFETDVQLNKQVINDSLERNSNIIIVSGTLNDRSIILNWNMPENKVDFFSYNLYNNDEFVKRITDINVLTHTIDDLIYSKRYIFQIELEETNKNILSNKLSIIPIETINLITNLDIDILSHDKKLTLNIRNDVLLNEYTYTIYYKSGENWIEIFNKDTTTYKSPSLIIKTIKNLENWKQYNFKIIGKDVNNNERVKYEFTTLNNIISLNNNEEYDFYNTITFPINYELIITMSNNIINSNQNVCLLTTNDNYNFDLSNIDNKNEYLMININNDNQLQLIIYIEMGYIIKTYSKNINDLLYDGENIMYLSFYKDKLLFKINNIVIFDEVIEIYFRQKIDNVYLYKANDIQIISLNEIITPLDTMPPNVVENFVITIEQNRVKISWDIITNDTIKEYIIYKNQKVYKIISTNEIISSTSYDVISGNVYFMDTDVKLDKEYIYEIEVVDTNNNKSEKILQKIVLTDKTPPLYLKKIDIESFDGESKIQWENNNNYYDVGGYNLLRKQDNMDWIEINNFQYEKNKKYEYIDTGLINGKIYYYKLEVVDNTGNISINNKIFSGTPYSIPKIKNFVVLSGNEQASLSWDKSTSGIFNLYKITRFPNINSETHSEIVGSSSKIDFPIYINNIDITTFVDYSLKNDIEYTYSIVEIDNLYNSSVEIKKTVIPKKESPDDFLNVSFNSSTSDLNSLTIDWNADKTNNFVVYKIYINNKKRDRLFSLNTKKIGNNIYTLSNLENNKSYNIALVELNNKKHITNTYYFKGSPIDIPPSPPTNVSCIPSKSQVYLSWNNNTEIDLSEYFIYKNDKLLKKISYLFNEWIDYDVKLGEDYSYYIIACDKGLNKSKKSKIITCKIEEVVGPPKTPTNIMIHPKKNNLEIVFDENTEKDLHDYNIYKNGVLFDKIYKMEDKYYNKTIIPYENHSHSSFKNGGATGLDRDLSDFWKGNMNDNGWISDIDKPITIKKGLHDYTSTHWIQFDMKNNQNILGFIYKPISKLIYNKKISIKISPVDNNWSNENWIEIVKNKSELLLSQPLNENEMKLFFPETINGRFIRIYIFDFEDQAGGNFTILYDLKHNLKQIKYIDRQVLLNNHYRYNISARDIYKQESIISTTLISSPVDLFPGNPSLPLNFTGIEKSEKVILKWLKNNESDVKYYYIYRSIASNDYQLIYKLGINSIELTLVGDMYQMADANLTNGETYKYKITAVDDEFNESLTSAELVLTPQNIVPHKPNELKLIPGFNSMKLVWRENDDDIDKYKIYRGLTNSVQHVYDINSNNWSILGKNICFVDINVLNNTEYFYSLTAVDKINQESEKTDIIIGIPQDNPPKKPNILNISNHDNYLSLVIELNTIEFDIFSYILYRSVDNINYEIINFIYTDYYIINLPLNNYIFSSFKKGNDKKYKDPRINIFNAATNKSWIANDNNPYLELIIPETDIDKTIIGLAIQGMDDLNYPKKFKFKTTTTNVYPDKWDLFDNDLIYVENNYNMSKTLFKVLFKEKKRNIKKIRIEPLNTIDSWKGRYFSMKCGLLIENNIIDKNIIYNDYNLINGKKYYYKLQTRDVKDNSSIFSDVVSSIPTDFSPPEEISKLTVENFYKSIKLIWDSSNDIRFSYYKIYKQGVFYSNTFDSTYTDNINIENNIKYVYNVNAVDIYGNESNKGIEGVGYSIISDIPTFTIEKTSHNSINIRCSLYNSRTILQRDIFYIASYNKSGESGNIIHSNSNFILLDNLQPDSVYEIKIKYMIDSLEGGYSSIKTIKTQKVPSGLNDIGIITNFVYEYDNRNINLSWDKNINVWDLKEYYITIKKNTGKDSITNMEDIIVKKDINKYVVEKFDSSTIYEIKIYSKTELDILSNPAIINIETPEMPDKKLYDETLKTINDIEKNINIFTIKEISDAILKLENNKIHGDFVDKVKILMIALKERKTYLESYNETNDKIEEINILLNNKNINDINIFLTNQLEFVSNIDLRDKYDFKIKQINNLLISNTNKNATQDNINYMTNALLNGILVDFVVKYELLSSFIPIPELVNIYNNLFLEYTDKKNILENREKERKSTIAIIDEIKTKTKDSSIVDINILQILLIEVEKHKPYSFDNNLELSFNEEKTKLIRLIDQLKVKEKEQLTWLSKKIEKKKIINYSYNKSFITWENESFKGLSIIILNTGINVYFDWMELNSYFENYIYFNENIKIQELLNTYTFRVNVVRYLQSNKGYKTVHKDVNVKFRRIYNTKYTGEVYISNDDVYPDKKNIFIAGDLLTIGDKWLYKDSLSGDSNIFKTFTFEDVKSNIKNDGIIKNSFFEYKNIGKSTFQMYDDVDFTLIQNKESQGKLIKNVDSVNNNIMNTLTLNQVSLGFPNKNITLQESIKSMTMWFKNWNSEILFSYNDITINNDEEIQNITVLDENARNVYIIKKATNTNVNIYNNNKWIFLYLEFLTPISQINKNDIKINSDGDVDLGEINFYKKKLSYEQIKKISQKNTVSYKINVKNAETITNSSIFLKPDDSENYDNVLIGVKNMNYTSIYINTLFKTELTKKWKLISGTFKKRLIVDKDIYTTEGFDDLLYSLRVGENYPKCVGISKIDNKYYLMERTLEQLITTGDNSWILEDELTSDHNWEKFFLYIRDENNKLELPTINIINSLDKLNIITLNQLYYIVFPRDSVLYNNIINKVDIIDVFINNIYSEGTPLINNDIWVDTIINIIKNKKAVIIKYYDGVYTFYILFKFVYKMIDFPIDIIFNTIVN